MTKPTVIKRKKEVKSPLITIICLLLTALMLLFGKELESAVFSGMSLAALRIIPTIFPFMILSDFWISVAEIKNDSAPSSLFEKVFKINGSAIIPFLTGIICGFPLGVKTAVDLHKQGAISKDELERLAPIINLPSLAFVISGVGAGLYGNILIGILLYISVLLSSIIIGFLLSFKKQKSKNSPVISRQSFDLVRSVKDAGFSSLAIASYIIFFSGVIGLASALMQNRCIVTLLSAFFEVGNSTSMVVKSGLFSPAFSFSLTAFALGFSGLSVHLQSFSFMPSDISKKRYLFVKLLVGILSAVLILPLSLILGII